LGKGKGILGGRGWNSRSEVTMLVLSLESEVIEESGQGAYSERGASWWWRAAARFEEKKEDVQTLRGKLAERLV